VVTGSRIDNPDRFALDASMYAQYPGWLADALTGDTAQSILIAVLTAASLAEPTPLGEGAVVVVTASRSRAVSTLRLTREGEKFVRYESGHPAFSRITQAGGVKPNTYAAPLSDGFVPVSRRAAVYNLPDPMILRTESYFLSPPPNTLIIGPRSVMGGSGSEVLFPFGF
jgi:hypothetical protein